MAGERITIDISILQGIFGDLTKLQQQLVGVSGGAVALDNTTAAAFADMQKNLRSVTGAVNGVENAFDAGMRNVVADIMAPLAKTQELEGKLRDLGERVRTSRSVGEIVKLKKEIAATQQELNGVDPSAMERKVGGAASRMRSMFGGLVAPVAGAFAVGGVVGFTRSVVEAVSGAENFNASMKVMLGGQEQAARMSKDLREFAVATPFDVPGLREYTTQLNSANVAQKDIIPTLDVLGNIAAGVGSDKLPQIVRAFTQVKNKAKLEGGEMLQFQEAGVPLLEELAKLTGKKTSEISGNIAKMNIPFAMVEKALANMTGEGGKFHDLMAAQANTVGGQINAAGETWAGFLEDVGMALLPQIKSAVVMFTDALEGVKQGFLWVVDHKDTILSVLKGIGIAVGIYTAALVVNNASLIANNALQAIAAIRIGAMAVVMNLVTAATSLWTGAQWLLNVALNANPIGLVIIAITALVGGIVWAWNNVSGFRAAIYGLWEAAKTTFNGLWNTAKSVLVPLSEMVMGLGTLLKGVFTMNWSEVKAGWQQMAKGTADALVNIAEAPSRIKEVGMQTGIAYAQGQVAGMASFILDKKAGEQPAGEAAGTDAQKVMAAAGQNMGASSLVGGAPTAQPTGKSDGVSVGGSGGSGRSITMTITMNNAFALPKDGNMGAREATERIVSQLVNKLNDAQFAMG